MLTTDIEAGLTSVPLPTPAAGNVVETDSGVAETDCDEAVETEADASEVPTETGSTLWLVLDPDVGWAATVRAVGLAV